jgi:hypothetical protein
MDEVFGGPAGVSPDGDVYDDMPDESPGEGYLVK